MCFNIANVTFLFTKQSLFPDKKIRSDRRLPSVDMREVWSRDQVQNREGRGHQKSINLRLREECSWYWYYMILLLPCAIDFALLFKPLLLFNLHPLDCSYFREMCIFSWVNPALLRGFLFRFTRELFFREPIWNSVNRSKHPIYCSQREDEHRTADGFTPYVFLL